MDELSEPLLHGSRRRQCPAVVIAVLQPTAAKGQQVSSQAVARDQIRRVAATKAHCYIKCTCGRSFHLSPADSSRVHPVAMFLTLPRGPPVGEPRPASRSTSFALLYATKYWRARSSNARLRPERRGGLSLEYRRK